MQMGFIYFILLYSLFCYIVFSAELDIFLPQHLFFSLHFYHAVKLQVELVILNCICSILCCFGSAMVY